MNMADKQEALVAKTLGTLAYESVFIYQTDNEQWTRIYIFDDALLSADISGYFGSDFSVAITTDIRSLLIRNNKILKAA
jgi:hypothetical protein